MCSVILNNTEIYSLEALMYAYVHNFFFSPQQDTIVALKALSEFAALMNVEETNIQVTVEGPSSLSPVKFVIDTQNRFLLQTAEVWTRGWLSEYLCS